MDIPTSTPEAITTLYAALGRPPPDPLPTSLLKDDTLFDEIAARLRAPGAGARGDDVCRWLYHAFSSLDPSLHLFALAFVPSFAGAYLPRAARQPLPGIETILLAMHAHVVATPPHPTTITIPSADHRSIYNSSGPVAVDLAKAELTPALVPRDTIRDTERGKIVGAALGLYLAHVAAVPESSRLEFCAVCSSWTTTGPERVALPWELLQPSLRILGHCLWTGGSTAGPAATAARGLLSRAMQEMDPRAILAVRSLIRAWELSPSVVFMGEPPLFT